MYFAFNTRFVSAMKIHISESTKAYVDKYTEIQIDLRGQIEMKVSLEMSKINGHKFYLRLSQARVSLLFPILFFILAKYIKGCV